MNRYQLRYRVKWATEPVTRWHKGETEAAAIEAARGFYGAKNFELLGVERMLPGDFPRRVRQSDFEVRP